MERRAAAIYFVFFLVIGAGTYGYITVVDAQQPTVSVEGEELSQNDPFTVDGRTYVVTEIGDGSGTLAWTNDSAVETATLEANASTTYNNESWTVVIEDRDDVSEFTLREEFNVSALLAADPEVDNETVERDGREYVVYRDNQSLQLLEAYLPERDTRTFAEGDIYEYPAESGVVNATVQNVTNASVALSWTTTSENTVDASEGGNVTLNGQTYVAHFPDNETMVLSQDFQAYQEEVERQNYFQERKNGLWGVSIISFAAAFVLLGAAYLPVKD